MDKVVIKVKGRQRSAEGGVTRVDMEADGQYCMKAGKHYITYDDTSISKYEPVATTIKASASEVLIMRKGALASRQRFSEGVEAVSDYATPYGVLKLMTRTAGLSVDLSDKGGRIKLDYQVFVNGDFSGRNRLEIEIVRR